MSKLLPTLPTGRQAQAGNVQINDKFKIERIWVYFLFPFWYLISWIYLTFEF
jgi:hypothetical protein